jgi:hypothetical protein
MLLILLVVAVAAATRAGVALDWSADRRFTLSPRLSEIIRSQNEPVELLAVWGVDQREANAPLEALLKRMGELQPKVTFRRLDPLLQKPELDAFSAKHGEALADSLYVCRGTRTFAISINPSTRFSLQRQVGGALVSLADANPPLAIVTQGHGELRPDGGAEHGGNLLVHGLNLAGFQVQIRDATAATRPPADAVLVVAGPTGPMGEPGIKLLEEHVQDGGSALILADDRAGDDLTGWLWQHGIALGAPPTTTPDPGQAPHNPRRILVSPRNHIKAQEVIPYHNLAIQGGQVNPNHPITVSTALAGQAVFSPWTTPLFPLDPRQFGPAAQTVAEAFTRAGTPPFVSSPLLATVGGDSWDKRRSDPIDPPQDLDQRPPVPIAWAIEYQPHERSVRANIGARLLVWGSRQAASDAVLSQLQFGNDQLLRSGVSWLARRATPTDIPTADVAAFQVTASEGTLAILVGFLVAIVPCMFLGAAMLTWWDRR